MKKIDTKKIFLILALAVGLFYRFYDTQKGAENSDTKAHYSPSGTHQSDDEIKKMNKRCLGGIKIQPSKETRRLVCAGVFVS